MKRSTHAPVDPLVAVAYARVSTSDQRLSQSAQDDAISAWATRAGVTVCSRHVDVGVSGAAPLDRRPGLVLALDALESSSAGVLVVAKRDRLARDVLVAAYLESRVRKLGARIVSIAGEGEGDDPAARLMRQIVDAFAEYERQVIIARTRAALAVKRGRGERTGGVPYGRAVAADGRTLAPDAAEGRELARAAELRAAGLSFGQIARRLTAEGFRSRGGRAVSRARAFSLVRAEAGAKSPV